ncbi:FAD-dependent oxidoreductase [Bacillus salacetis]|uniref:FAD-dependent oxidoreductase n=1 Tax=Bacillus salacetis TaxID=2315464 RepID=UPI003BA03A52
MPDVILVGGGHAHLHCLKKIIEEPVPETRFILVSPSKYQYYSGMFSGYTEGLYSESDIRIDLEELCRKSGVLFLKDAAVKINPEEKILLLSSGHSLPFTYASFDIGSGTNVKNMNSEIIQTVKPNYRFPEIIRELQDSPSPVIVGGGAAGVELSLTILARKKRLKQDGKVTLISASGLIPQESDMSSKKLEKVCRDKGLSLVLDEQVEEVTNTVVKTNNQTLAHSGVLFVTGPSAFPIFKESGLMTTEEGFLAVTDTLQSKSHPFIFGAGDCVSLLSYKNLAKNGVFAVRQGPVLWENIKRTLTNSPVIKFTPQKRYLSILSTGEKQALLIYGPLYLHGRLPWRTKNIIDKKFLMKYT